MKFKTRKLNLYTGEIAENKGSFHYTLGFGLHTIRVFIGTYNTFV